MLRKSSVEVFERVARHALAYDPTVGPEAEESCVAVLHELVDFYLGSCKGPADGDAPSGCPSCGSVGGEPVGWEAGAVAWLDRRGRYEVERLASRALGLSESERTHVYRAAANPERTSGGFHWEVAGARALAV